ncbi:taste receptor type 2 member 42-like [Protopterus annectens]|uniref:taste receptor type 2 member 42-like n=1 Tax=Protopterus annectens TaxID=7888 RepID=UPI001CFAC67F|nr:taste receptor type 2 member 42-like [Protopterus annectens]
MFSSIWNSWLLVCLSVFYCLKIVNSANRYFNWVKQNISAWVPYLVIAAATFAVILTSLPLCDTSFLPNSNVTSAVGNFTLKEEFSKGLSYYISFLLLGCILPFALMVASSVSIIVSLNRHTRRLQSSSTSFSSPRSEVHMRVAKMITYQIFNGGSYVASLMCSIFFCKRMNITLYIIFSLVSLNYTTICSALMIYGNVKLREYCIRRCKHVKCPQIANRYSNQ